ncbi:reverse transcriptase [Corchorus capsularis]|uniref:Reverse transcriptase n=1 Tax=Corchorus capsularis TaxID=210143 RepID=A0A1R3JNE6_COCAP|nr:reverse transcriptase [Corchorus capsularis]
MSCLAWNCRGLGASRAIHVLSQLVKCRAGGLALLWQDPSLINIVSFSSSHIDANVRSSTNREWRLTGFYGRPETSRRHESWDLLRQLSEQSTLPWMCVGDFNEILTNDEKIGGPPRSQRQMEMFRATVEFCEFRDLPIKGPLMTWSRLMSSESDHLPLHIEILDKPWVGIHYNHRFRFERMWLTHDGVQTIINGSWNVQQEMSIQQRIASCAQSLQHWDKTVFGNVRYSIRKKKRDLERYYKEAQRNGLSGPLNDCLNDIHELYDREESMWRQRSKVSWLREGDRNSRFFHSIVNSRKNQTTISSIQDANGEWQTDLASMEHVVCSYFKDIFTSSKPLHSDVEQVLGVVERRVTADMNAQLVREFTMEEIRVATFDMGADKSPGPDGMPPLFYQKYWHVVGAKVSEMALAFLNSGVSLPDVNQTDVVLLPKIDHPSSVRDYRPISLCNVIFKIVSKTLANRLREVLPFIIDPNQSAFVPGRMIFDSSIIAFESIHYMKNKRSGGEKHMALKLDLSKAYDRVEWVFLERIMARLGFSNRWVSLVMECLRTVTYSILVNGRRTESFVPSRGIRQGDPLSPYLFLFCMEGLSCLLQRAELNDRIHGVAVSRYAPRISHLFFADDSLLFLRASSEECDVVLDLLRQFELASGQQVNIDKSAVMFSCNTPGDLQEIIMHHLGIQKVLDRDRYLGLPIMIGRSKSVEFHLIKDRLWKQLRSWSGKLLSIAGKAVMIQSIAQAIPTYLRSCFRFPKTFLYELNMLIAKFWWGSTDSRNKIHWKAWDSLCTSKLDGGLGFRDFESFNMALLAKQCWRLIQDGNSLCFQVLKAKYFYRSSFMQATLGHNPSFVWRSLLAGREVIRSGSRWRIGNGQTVDIWRDRWLAKPSSYQPAPRPGIVLQNNPVSSLFNNDGYWDEDLLSELFEDEDVYRILCIPLHFSSTDRLIWNHSVDGHYTVRSGYHVVRRILGKEVAEVGARSVMWRLIWGANVVPKVKFFYVAYYSWEDFWDCLLSKASQLGSLDVVCMVLWMIWSNRNKALYEQVCKLPQSLCLAVNRFMFDFDASNRRAIGRPIQEQRVWQPPANGLVKINADAAFYQADGLAVLVAVIRDYTGRVLLSGTTKIDRVTSVLFAEVYAIRFGLVLAYSFGYTSCEDGSVAKIGVKILWKPSKCPKCKVFGHQDCFKKVEVHMMEKQWIPEVVEPVREKTPPPIDCLVLPLEQPDLHSMDSFPPLSVEKAMSFEVAIAEQAKTIEKGKMVANSHHDQRLQISVSRYAEILDDLKKDLKSHGGSADCIYVGKDEADVAHLLRHRGFKSFSKKFDASGYHHLMRKIESHSSVEDASEQALHSQFEELHKKAEDLARTTPSFTRRLLSKGKTPSQRGQYLIKDTFSDPRLNIGAFVERRIQDLGRTLSKKQSQPLIKRRIHVKEWKESHIVESRVGNHISIIYFFVVLS